MGRHTLIFFLILLSFPLHANERAGMVLDREGNVTLVRQQRSIQVSEKDWLYENDKILTGRKSSVEIKLIDGSIVNIGELGDVSLIDLAYDPIKKDGFIDIKIATGAFRMVSGSIAKLGPDLMVLKLPTATVGIRGTGVVGKASKVGIENFVILVPDPDGHIGELVVQNTEGIVVLRKANEGVTMIYPDRKLAKKKYTKKFIQRLIKQVPKIKIQSLQSKQFNSLFWFNN
jgi:hypothetical protein